MARTTPAPPPPADPDESGTDRIGAGQTGADETGAGTPGDSTASVPPLVDGGRPNRFFAWLRSLGIVRQPGWLGGVSAGLATRIGVDPLIVRGGLVVVALLGGPALLLYAAAWLLLPDEQDKIHLEQVTRGRFESAIAGIAALVALSMLPVTQGFWYAGSAFWGDPALPDSIGRALWTFALIALLAWGVVWMIRRGNTGAAGAAGAPSATPAPAPTPEPPAAVPPHAPAADASEAEFAAWREQQSAWKTEYDTYREQANAASLRAQEEYRQQRLAAAAVNAERMRAWHRANPRLRASIVVMVLGAAVVAGGIASQLAPAGRELVVGLGIATLVVGLTIIVAGLARRRNGFLSFVAMLLLPATLVAAFVPSDRQLLLISSGTIDATVSQNYAKPTGSIDISASAPEDDTAEPVTIDIWHGTGDLDVYLEPGASVRLVGDIRSGTFYHTQFVTLPVNPEIADDYNEDGVVDEFDDTNGDGVVNRLDNATVEGRTNDVTPTVTRPRAEDSWDTTFGTSESARPTLIIHLWQGVGDVRIQDAYPENY